MSRDSTVARNSNATSNHLENDMWPLLASGGLVLFSFMAHRLNLVRFGFQHVLITLILWWQYILFRLLLSKDWFLKGSSGDTYHISPKRAYL